MNSEALANLFQLSSVIKLFVLVFSALFVVFTLVFLNQLRVMARIVNQPPVSSSLVVIALLQLLVAIGIFLIVLLVL